MSESEGDEQRPRKKRHREVWLDMRIEQLKLTGYTKEAAYTYASIEWDVYRQDYNNPDSFPDGIAQKWDSDP